MDALSNALRPAVPVTIAGKTYPLRFDFEAIAEAEEIVNLPLITGLQARDITSPKVKLVRAMFFAAAHYDQPSLTFEDAKKLITRENLVDVWVKVLEAWTISNPEPEAAQANPTPDPS